jgi:hypothetical protein
MVIVVLSTLAFSLLMRSRVSKEPEDVISAAKYLRHLRDPAHGSFTFLRQEVTALLVETLAFQMELNASGVVQTLEEMAVLTHELLTSDPSSAFTTRAIVVLASSPHSDKLLFYSHFIIESNYRVLSTGKGAQTRDTRGFPFPRQISQLSLLSYHE